MDSSKQYQNQPSTATDADSISPTQENQQKSSEGNNASFSSPIKDLLADYPPLLTVKQVAEIFQVRPLTIKRWGKKGILPPIRINSRGDRRYTKEQVLWLIGQRSQEQVPSINRGLAEIEQNFNLPSPVSIGKEKEEKNHLEADLSPAAIEAEGASEPGSSLIDNFSLTDENNFAKKGKKKKAF